MPIGVHRRRLQQIVRFVFAGNVTTAAKACNTNPQTMHQILNGEIKEPRLSTLEKLAAHFGVSLEWMIGKTDFPDTDNTRQNLRKVAGVPPMPIWWDLLSNYHDAARIKDIEFLNEAMGLKGQGKKLLDAYWHSKGIKKNPDGVPRNSDEFFTTLIQIARKEFGDIPNEFIPMVRSVFEAETLTLGIVVKQIRKLEGRR